MFQLSDPSRVDIAARRWHTLEVATSGWFRRTRSEGNFSSYVQGWENGVRLKDSENNKKSFNSVEALKLIFHLLCD